MHCIFKEASWQCSWGTNPHGFALVNSLLLLLMMMIHKLQAATAHVLSSNRTTEGETSLAAAPQATLEDSRTEATHQSRQT
jgi:hypothetical protein